MTAGNIFLESAIKRLTYYQSLGDKTFEQLSEEELHWQPDEGSNSIAVIIQHLSGNMLSRWTSFLDDDGEKEWRNRDSEFEDRQESKQELLSRWQQGWDCLLNTLKNLQDEDLLKTITIRREPLTVIDAINRQLAHYPYHVGQIICLAKMIRKENWKSLSIPKGQSEQFNQQMKSPPAKRG